MTKKQSVSDCIVLPIKDFAVRDLEDTNDRISLWQSADDLAKVILSSLEEHGYVLK